MPSIYQLKPAFQNLLRPLVNTLHRAGVTANQVTLTAMFASVILAGFLYVVHGDGVASAWLLLFPAWMLVRMAFNAVDGMLAREFGQQSTLGAYYNELCDVVSDTALYACLVAFVAVDPWLLFSAVFLAGLSEYAGVMAPLVGAARRYDGPMGKSDRAFAFGVIAVLLVVGPVLGASPQVLHLACRVLLAIICVLLLWTIAHRVRNGVGAAR
ncbi:CDP-alcohol phosphatidyltransferase family protein [Diaphorobacter aerolatus]|uniref:CDP-alcohol phosphatidyltransferase family protein n=1 Tax=Diaphorobacter aerolatus TaxID=1288495 RepID=A0A7H0GPC5_9BURK|nr:CDP-alcohol phosphatidyltransferase family protein [Diaphorobacter aerolatus]QNP50141.1 CDP-alcohol phosphatidyltransferase family protein [Diaphorobacter aerolatus]